MTKVSIIIPIYNAAKYLRECISDILHQTYSFYELICVDDGSVDDSLNILKEYAQNDLRIKILEQNNMGAGAARNAGLQIATGEFLLFLDADDRFEQNLLNHTVTVAQETKADIVIFDAECFDSVTGKHLDSNWIVKKNILPPKHIFSYRDCPDVIFNIEHSAAWNKLYNASFVRKALLKFQNVPYGNDVLFTRMSLVKAGRISVLDEKLIRYRQNNTNSLSGTSVRERNPLCLCEVMRELRNSLISEEIYTFVWKSFTNYALEHLLWNLERFNGEAYYLLYKVLREELFVEFEVSNLDRKDYLYPEMCDKVEFIIQNSGENYLFYLLKNKHNVIAKMSRDFGELLQYSEDQKEQILLLREKKRWYFDESKIPFNSKVVVYGAGDVGTDYVDQFAKTKYCNVVAWIDKNFQNIQGKKMKIVSPESIVKDDFDYIIIANASEKSRQDIKRELSKIIDKDKII